MIIQQLIVISLYSRLPPEYLRFQRHKEFMRRRHMHIESLEVDEGCQGTANENIDVDLKKSIKSIFKNTN